MKPNNAELDRRLIRIFGSQTRQFTDAMRKAGEVAFCVGLTLAGIGWALLVIGGPVLRHMPLVAVGAGVMLSGFGLCMAMGIAALWSDVLGRK